MGIGSLVELIDDNWRNPKVLIRAGIKLPVKGLTYTVRGIDSYGDGIFLEEIVNRKYQFSDGYAEPSFAMRRFRELLPPMEVDVNKFIEEVMRAE